MEVTDYLIIVLSKKQTTMKNEIRLLEAISRGLLRFIILMGIVLITLQIIFL